MNNTVGRRPGGRATVWKSSRVRKSPRRRRRRSPACRGHLLLLISLIIHAASSGVPASCRPALQHARALPRGLGGATSTSTAARHPPVTCPADGCVAAAVVLLDNDVLMSVAYDGRPKRSVETRSLRRKKAIRGMFTMSAAGCENTERKTT